MRFGALLNPSAQIAERHARVFFGRMFAERLAAACAIEKFLRALDANSKQGVA